jgi:hypothetical protein
LVCALLFVTLGSAYNGKRKSEKGCRNSVEGEYQRKKEKQKNTVTWCGENKQC